MPLIRSSPQPGFPEVSEASWFFCRSVSRGQTASLCSVTQYHCIAVGSDWLVVTAFSHHGTQLISKDCSGRGSLSMQLIFSLYGTTTTCLSPPFLSPQAKSQYSVSLSTYVVVWLSPIRCPTAQIFVFDTAVPSHTSGSNRPTSSSIPPPSPDQHNIPTTNRNYQSTFVVVSSWAAQQLRPRPICISPADAGSIPRDPLR